MGQHSTKTMLAHGWSVLSFPNCKKVLSICHTNVFDESRIHCLAKAYREQEGGEGRGGSSLFLIHLIVVLVLTTILGLGFKKVLKILGRIQEQREIVLFWLIILLALTGSVKVRAENETNLLSEQDRELLIVAKNLMSWWSDFHQMTWTSLWHTVPFAVMCMIVGGLITIGYPAIRYGLYPLVRDLFGFLGSLINWIFSSFCCAAFCAGKPFVWIRVKSRKFWLNYWVGRRIERVQEMEPLEEIVIGSSRFKSDEQGMYLQFENVKIYLDNGVNDALMAASAPPYKRDVNEGVKETKISTSGFFKAQQMPKFQGLFEAGGIVIGHFSRINYKGRDCLLTAYHVLEYNKNADIMVTNNGVSFRLHDIPSRVACYSKSEELDFIILEIPTTIFSRLGLKVAKIASSCGLGTPVAVYQTKTSVTGERVNCYAMGCVSKDNRSWYFKHGASTVVGASGAAVLNSKMAIVGVHVEGGTGGCNYGVVPPVLRAMKESPQNDDIVGGDNMPRNWKNYDSDSDDDSIYDGEDEQMTKAQRKAEQRALEEEETRELVRAAIRRDLEARSEFKLRSWVDIMEEEEESENFETAYVPKFKGSSIPAPLGNRRESPWTCVECGVVQSHHAFNCIKCGMPMKPAAKAVDECKQAITTVKDGVDSSNLPYPCMVKIMEELTVLKERMEKFSEIENIFSRKSLSETSWFRAQGEAMDKMMKAMDSLKIEVLEVDKKLVNALEHKVVGPYDLVENPGQDMPPFLGVLTVDSAATGKPIKGLSVKTDTARIAESVAIVPVNRVKDSEKETKQKVAKAIKVQVPVVAGAFQPSVKRDVEAEIKKVVDEKSTAIATEARKNKAKLRRQKEKDMINGLKAFTPGITNKEARKVLASQKKKETVKVENMEVEQAPIENEQVPLNYPAPQA